MFEQEQQQRQNTRNGTQTMRSPGQTRKDGVMYIPGITGRSTWLDTSESTPLKKRKEPRRKLSRRQTATDLSKMQPDFELAGEVANTKPLKGSKKNRSKSKRHHRRKHKSRKARIGAEDSTSTTTCSSLALSQQDTDPVEDEMSKPLLEECSWHMDDVIHGGRNVQITANHIRSRSCMLRRELGSIRRMRNESR